MLLVLVAHAILETSRDALFLSNVPARRLPWVYLAIAALALPGIQIFGRHHGVRSAYVGLIAAQIAAAVGTLSFLFLSKRPGTWAFYALYIWGGLASTLIVARFWLLLSDRFTASQAKRLFPVIAAGAVVGSVIGFAVSGLVGRRLTPNDLLGVSAGMYLLSAAASFALSRATAARTVEAERARGGVALEGDDRASAGNHPFPALEPSGSGELGFIESARMALRHPYVRQLTLILLLASVTATLGDYIFKTVVARSLAPARLSSFFASTYFTFNAISLAVLLLAVTPFVRAIGVTTALALQPVLLIGGSFWLVAGGGLAAAVGLRGVDGAMRWSLSKTATELLFVPMPARLRNAVKGLSDVLAHRGGQALASVVILFVMTASDSPRATAGAMIVCAAAWTYLALSLRNRYVHLFRTTLAEASIQTRLDFPDLDVASLETLIAALSSPDDTRVIAAMDLLQEKNRAHVIPGLILYHPSPPIVVRALELFTRSERDDFLPLTDRLLAHPSAEVRAAAVRARAVVRPDAEDLRRAQQSNCPVVAATATVALAAHGWMRPEEASAELTRRLDADGTDLGRHVAQALRHNPSPAFHALLKQLAHAADERTRCEAVRAIGAARDADLAPELVACLGDRAMRDAAREALLELGEPALDHLQRALENADLPRATRAHVPRTLARFPEQRPADILLRQLVVEADGMVRYKILRGLGSMMRRDPSPELAPEVLDQVIAGHLYGIFQLLHWRVTLEQAASERPEWRTTGYELLTSLLRHKTTLATERLFRLLGLRYRLEDVGQIYTGLHSADAQARSSSRELLEHMLTGDLRKAVIGLVDEIADDERLATGSVYYNAEPIEAVALVAALRDERSVSVSCLAAFYAGQIGVDGGAVQGGGEVREETSLARLREKWVRAFRGRRTQETETSEAEPPEAEPPPFDVAQGKPDPLLGKEGGPESRQEAERRRKRA